MSAYEWPLTEILSSESNSFQVSATDVPGTPPGWSVTKRTLRAGLSQGVEIVEIHNGRTSFIIVPTRGMGLWRATIGDRVLGWRSPVRGPVHPAFVPIAESSGLGWLGGFDELMCRCGLESNGAPDFDERGQLLFPLHGRIANRPAHELKLVIDDVAGTICLRGIVEESRFHYQKLRLHVEYTTRFQSSQLSWHDNVENYGGVPAQMQMLYHINIGQPQLDGGSTIVAPLAWMSPGNSDTESMGIDGWDRYSSPTPGFHQQVYQLGVLADEQGNSGVLLKNSSGSSGVRVSFNTRELPCFSLWKNTVTESDGYVTGIEPATNFPNPRRIEEKQGRVITLQPRESWRARVDLDWILEPAGISRVERSIAELQTMCQPTYHKQVFYAAP